MSEATLRDTSFIEAVRRRQRLSALATLAVTLLLFAGIGGLVLYSWLRLEGLRRDITVQSAALVEAKTKLQAAQQELAQTTAKLQASQEALAKAQQAVAEASNYVKHVHPLDWRNEKLLMAYNPPYIIEILGQAQAANLHFGLANTPQGGFTSPGFAEYVLARAGAHIAYDQLPVRSGSPRPGDLVRYDAGYTMFYFQDAPPKSEPFVVGMTPIGIASLEVNFGPRIIEVRKTPFSK